MRMGTMGCDRKNCDNIMCDKLSDIHGYICNECYEALINSGPETNVAAFMNTEPAINNRDEAKARYAVVFRVLNL